MRLEEGIEFVQAAILLRDTILQPRYRTEERVWRAEDQAWRREDRAWRQEDLDWRDEEQRFMDAQRKWRLYDIEQLALDNARILWSRFVEKNRRSVEERAEQLKSLGNLAALVAGFAVVAFLEFGSADDFKSEREITAAFGFTAALVVGLNTQVMVASSLLHASILRGGKLYVSEEAEAEFMAECLVFSRSFPAEVDPPVPSRTFDKYWSSRCESTWRWAYALFVAGLMSFIVNLTLAAWIKFSDDGLQLTAMIVTAVLATCLLLILRSLAFWAPHLFNQGDQDNPFKDHVLQPSPEFGFPFVWHRVPVPRDLPQVPLDAFQDARSNFASHLSNSSHTDDCVGIPVANNGDLGAAEAVCEGLESPDNSSEHDENRSSSHTSAAIFCKTTFTNPREHFREYYHAHPVGPLPSVCPGSPGLESFNRSLPRGSGVPEVQNCQLASSPWPQSSEIGRVNKIRVREANLSGTVSSHTGHKAITEQESLDYRSIKCDSEFPNEGLHCTHSPIHGQGSVVSSTPAVHLHYQQRSRVFHPGFEAVERPRCSQGSPLSRRKVS